MFLLQYSVLDEPYDLMVLQVQGLW